MVKLIVHIGHGKTGSSSIQESLQIAETELSRQNLCYLGIMLENANTKEKLPWQVKSGSNHFFTKISPQVANSQLLDVLSHELNELSQQGVSKAIWSNEWLFSRSQFVQNALEQLREKGYDIEVQCYVRRHDKWAQSSYAQWGLKHKFYNGPIKSFEDWINIFGDRDFQFGPTLNIWHSMFGEKFRVFNFEMSRDVVKHFATINGIENLITVHDNVSPSPVQTAIQAVFNSRFSDPVLPNKFDNFQEMFNKADENQVLLPDLNNLFPSVDVLEKLVQDRTDDIREVNALLIKNRELPLTFDVKPKQMQHPSPWEMDQMLLKYIFGLSEEIFRLRQEVAMLRREIRKDKATQ